MPAGSPGSLSNAEWGFTPSDSGRVTWDGDDTGFLQGDVGISVPRDYAYLTLDQAVVDLAAACIHKAFLVSFAMGEALLENLRLAWDNAAPSLGVLSVGAASNGTKALVVNTNPPGNDGNDTRVITCPTAQAIGDGAWAITNARGGAPQSVGAQFRGIADGNGLLATVTDTYNA